MAMDSGASSQDGGKISDKVIITAIASVTILECVNMIYCKVDGTILSTIIGAIVFLATRKYYKSQ